MPFCLYLSSFELLVQVPKATCRKIKSTRLEPWITKHLMHNKANNTDALAACWISAGIMENLLIHTRSSNALINCWKSPHVKDYKTAQRISSFKVHILSTQSVDTSKRARKEVHKTKLIQFNICNLKMFKIFWHNNTIIKSHYCPCYQTVHIICLQGMCACMHLCNLKQMLDFIV